MVETVGTERASGVGAWRCAHCGTPLLRFDTVVEVGDVLYCSPNCDLASQRPELARLAQRGGGLVLTCAQCGTPIIVSELMVSVGIHAYCCPNCAEVARQAPAAVVAPPPATR